MQEINYIRLFDEYSITLPPLLRQLVNSIRVRVIECSKTGDFEKLDWSIQSSKTKRENPQKIVVGFYDYVYKKTGEYIDSPLRYEKYYDDPVRRQLEIAKFLHNPHTMEEIKDKFHISAKLARQDILELCDGIDVLGTKFLLM